MTPNPSQSLSGTKSPHRPASKPLPVPPERPEQCQAPSISDVEPSSNLIPVQAPALVLVPEHTIDLASRDPKPTSNSLPVALERPEHYFSLSIPDIEPIPNLIPVPSSALVPAPVHAIDLPSGDPSQVTSLLTAWPQYQCQ
ncbi:uncharacterized protein [Macrobrachium rosenbergii]|uniref:uncharacterized protein n=1 Tax=Macrobrachium rosenbergii TaxID=79674 RepID=UPI0034D73E50